MNRGPIVMYRGADSKESLVIGCYGYVQSLAGECRRWREWRVVFVAREEDNSVAAMRLRDGDEMPALRIFGAVRNLRV